jgi:hypothetical protein
MWIAKRGTYKKINKLTLAKCQYVDRQTWNLLKGKQVNSRKMSICGSPNVEPMKR